MSATFSLLAPGILGITSFASLVDDKAVTTPPAAPMPGSFPKATLVQAAVASPVSAALEPGPHRLVLLASYELAPPCSGSATGASKEVLFTVNPTPVLQVQPVLPASQPCPGEPFTAEFEFSITGLTTSKGAVKVQGTAGFVDAPATAICDVKVVETVNSPDATAASGRVAVKCASPPTPFQASQAMGVKLSLTAGQDGCGSATAEATIRTTVACCLSTGAFVKFADSSSVTAPPDYQAKCLHMLNPYLATCAAPSSAAANARFKNFTSLPADLYGFVNKGATSHPPFTGRTISLLAGIGSQCASSKVVATMSCDPALDADASAADDSSRIVGFQVAVPRGSDLRRIRFWVRCKPSLQDCSTQPRLLPSRSLPRGLPPPRGQPRRLLPVPMRAACVACWPALPSCLPPALRRGTPFPLTKGPAASGP